MPMMTGVFMRWALRLFLELRFRHEVRDVIRTARIADDRGELAVHVLELVRRRFALQTDQVFGFVHPSQEYQVEMASGEREAKPRLWRHKTRSPPPACRSPYCDTPTAPSTKCAS